MSRRARRTAVLATRSSPNRDDKTLLREGSRYSPQTLAMEFALSRTSLFTRMGELVYNATRIPSQRFGAPLRARIPHRR